MSTISSKTLDMLTWALHVGMLIVQAGADVNAANNNGVTPLMLACKGGHADLVRLLLEYDAAVWLRTEDERTALHKVSASNGTTAMASGFTPSLCSGQVH